MNAKKFTRPIILAGVLVGGSLLVIFGWLGVSNSPMSSSDSTVLKLPDNFGKDLQALVASARSNDSADEDFSLAGVTDERLAVLVSELEPLGIQVSRSSEGVVLTGAVANRMDKSMFEELVEKALGVKSIVNQIQIDRSLASVAGQADGGSTPAQSITDATISAKVKYKLILEKDVSAEDVDVRTRERIVTLQGSVANAQNRKLAEHIAAGVKGVTQVKNLLLVRPVKAAAQRMQ